MVKVGATRIRPHHLLCIQGFRGQGYSPTFIANLSRIKEYFEAAPDAPVELVHGVDEICDYCPHLDSNDCTRPGQKVSELDRMALERMKLSAGMTESWSFFVDAICEHIDTAKMDEVCHGCNWIDLGFCAQGIEKLRRSRAS
jgi:hypothetical protein